MWLRRAFFTWMTPAVFVLPLWLLVGWIAFSGSGGTLLLMLFIAMPSVFVAQLLLMLLVRARSSVRAERAVSWWDVLGFGVWHALIVATGFFAEAWFAGVLFAACAAAVAVFWLTLWQLWREMRQGAAVLLRTAEGAAYLPPQQETPTPRREADVFVVEERPTER